MKLEIDELSMPVKANTGKHLLLGPLVPPDDVDQLCVPVRMADGRFALAKVTPDLAISLAIPARFSTGKLTVVVPSILPPGTTTTPGATTISGETTTPGGTTGYPHPCCSVDCWIDMGDGPVAWKIACPGLGSVWLRCGAEDPACNPLMFCYYIETSHRCFDHLDCPACAANPDWYLYILLWDDCYILG
jgi:hypothetical protein